MVDFKIRKKHHAKLFEAKVVGLNFFNAMVAK